MAKLFTNNGDPDQTPRSAASDLGLHYLTINLLVVSRLQRVKGSIFLKNRLFFLFLFKKGLIDVYIV